jgi:response regulator RpfG family c-di-GMP phosphodiesterase
MTQIKKRFLLVDDDPINNFLTKMILKNSFEEVHVNDFTIPEDGLEFMKSEPSHNPPDGKTTLFLDINMPTISGWEFLEAFEIFDASIKEQYNIYILSSSLHPSDIIRAKANPHVVDFIEKPLNKAMLVKMFG